MSERTQFSGGGGACLECAVALPFHNVTCSRAQTPERRIEKLESALRSLAEHDQYMVDQGILRPFVELDRAIVALGMK